LEGLLLGGLSADRARAVTAHLLHGCKECSARLAPYCEGLFGADVRLAAPLPPSEEAYDAALDRAFASVRQLEAGLPPVKTAEQKKRDALRLLASEGLKGLGDAPPDVQGLPLYEALLERSWALRHDDPDQMVQLAQFATLLVDRLNERDLGAREIADLRCRAWVELGNAYRAAEELDHAEGALGQATYFLLQGTQDGLLGARLFDVLASLWAARRFFESAIVALDIAGNIYRLHGDEHLAGRALISKGIYIGYQGNAEEAVRLIQQGLASVDGRRDPGLVSSTVQTQAWFLADCGRFKDAQRALWAFRCSGIDLGGRINELKVRWLEGHIFVGLADFEHAEVALRSVKEGFEEAGLPYKAALAGLELGVVWFRQGRFRKAEEAIRECADIFISLQIQRETLAAVGLLRKAAETRRLTLSLLERVIAIVREAERDPAAPFRPPAEP
jgi:tetratricopeptide (TPR) repeat protein